MRWVMQLAGLVQRNMVSIDCRVGQRRAPAGRRSWQACEGAEALHEVEPQAAAIEPEDGAKRSLLPALGLRTAANQMCGSASCSTHVPLSVWAQSKRGRCSE